MPRDYILRMIQQFIDALIGIVSARKAKKYEEAFVMVQTAGQRYLKMDVLAYLNMEPEDVLELFREDKHIMVDKCVFCADLLNELSLICREIKADEIAKRARALSLFLYLNTIPLDKDYQTDSYRNKIDELWKGLPEIDRPENIKHLITQHKTIL